MEKQNMVFIAASMDGYIADIHYGLDWLQMVPNPDNNDMGYAEFIAKTDAIVMGRRTFETVCSFDCDWPYTLPVFVLSNTLNALPDSHKNKASLINGTPTTIVKALHKKGYHRLYIDGGATIQSFLNADLIDELTITTIPILLGGGIPLFSELTKALKFNLIKSNVFLNAIVQSCYQRDRS